MTRPSAQTLAVSDAYRVRSVMETARALGLHPTQVQRAEASALKKLRVRLGERLREACRA